MLNQPASPPSLPEDEDMDPVGEPYPNQKRIPLRDEDDPQHPSPSPDSQIDIPRAAEKKSKLPALLMRSRKAVSAVCLQPKHSLPQPSLISTKTNQPKPANVRAF